MVCFFYCDGDHRDLHVLTHSGPTRRYSDLRGARNRAPADQTALAGSSLVVLPDPVPCRRRADLRCHHAGLQPARRRAERALRAQGAGGGADRRRGVRLLPVGPAPRRGGAVSARPVGQWLLVLAGVVVVATVIGAIAVMGSPGEQRKLRIDEHGINDLRAIEPAVRLHRKGTGSLPEYLATLDARPGVALDRADPQP